jgi:hypothetical protein
MKSKFRFLFVLVPVAFVTLAIFVTMSLWNWLMPALFGLTTITFLQAAGIFVLAKLLIGHKGHHGWHGHHMHYAYAGSCGPHSGMKANFMAHRWHNLTPEQRERFAGRCGYPIDPEKSQENPTAENR